MVSTQGFVLAGGKSTRMGRDKALMEWRGRTLLDHMVALLSSVTDRVDVVGRDHLPDHVPDRGPLGGIATALEVSEADANLVVAVDLPLLTTEFLKYFLARFEKSHSAVFVCNIESRFPLCMGFRKRILKDILERLSRGERSIHGLITGGKSGFVSEDELRQAGFDRNIFTNFNSPEDFRRAGG